MDRQKEIEETIPRILDNIRQYLQEDMGDIEFVRFDGTTGFVYVKLLGNCLNCPLSPMTLQAGILRFLQKDIPEVNRIVEIK
jgi:Fe-S cluster biogenesis protein NfuA